MLIYILIMIILAIFVFCACSDKIEKFWVYGAGTRVCNNRECDVVRTNISIPSENSV